MSEPTTPTQSSAPTGNGKAVAIGLVALGVIAGCITFFYWTNNWQHYRSAPNKPGAVNPGSTDPLGKQGEAQDKAKIEERFGELAVKLNKDLQQSPVPADVHIGLKAFVEAHPKHAQAHGMLAQAYLAIEELKPAYTHLTRSLELDSQQASMHLLAGTVAKEMDNWEGAERHYKDAIDVDAFEPEAHVHLATVYTKKRQFDEARDALLQALRLDATMHKAHRALAEVFAKQGKLVAALTQIDKAIELTTEEERVDAVPYVRFKAMLLRRDNKPGDAMHVLIYSLNAEEQADPEVVKDMALSLSMQKKFSQAAALYEKQMKLHPLEWEPAAEAAKWRIKSGEPSDLDTAKRHLEVIRRIDPRLPIIAELEAKLSK